MDVIALIGKFIDADYSLHRMDFFKQYTNHPHQPLEIQYFHIHGHIQHTKFQQINIIIAL